MFVFTGLSLAGANEINSKNETIAIVVNVDCIYCKELFVEHKEELKKASEKFKVNLAWIPIPNGIDAKTAWPERTFYATKILPISYQEDVLKHLMLAQEVKQLSSPEAVLAWLELNIPSVTWGSFFDEQVYNDLTIVSVEKGIRLAQITEIKSFPHYVHVTHEAPKSINLEGSIKEQVKKLIEIMESLKNEK